MAAISHGDTALGRSLGIPTKVATDFNQADKGTALLSQAMRGRADGGPANAAMRIARQKLDVGGATVSGGDAPWFERNEERNAAYGFNMGIGGGRNDKNPGTMGSSAYVLPADVVAGLGDGNSLAGAHIFDQVLHSMPYGIAPEQQRRGPGPPRPPSMAMANAEEGGVKEPPIAPGVANGGKPAKDGDEPTAAGEEKPVEVITADGEVLVSPRDVARIGARYSLPKDQANYAKMLAKGNNILDSYVKEIRGRTIRHLKSLPGPVGSKNPEKGHT
jgi:hypothetical protein